MFRQCPGQDRRNLKVETIVCSFCGYAVEFFSDEIKTLCPACRKRVFRKKMPSCVDWCRHAADCIGREKLTF
jgi:Fe-S-cluster-containing dehydrogenase component